MTLDARLHSVPTETNARRVPSTRTLSGSHHGDRSDSVGRNRPPPGRFAPTDQDRGHAPGVTGQSGQCQVQSSGFYSAAILGRREHPFQPPALPFVRPPHVLHDDLVGTDQPGGRFAPTQQGPQHRGSARSAQTPSPTEVTTEQGDTHTNDLVVSPVLRMHRPDRPRPWPARWPV